MSLNLKISEIIANIDHPHHENELFVIFQNGIKYIYKYLQMLDEEIDRVGLKRNDYYKGSSFYEGFTNLVQEQEEASNGEVIAVTCFLDLNGNCDLYISLLDDLDLSDNQRIIDSNYIVGLIDFNIGL